MKEKVLRREQCCNVLDIPMLSTFVRNYNFGNSFVKSLRDYPGGHTNPQPRTVVVLMVLEFVTSSRPLILVFSYLPSEVVVAALRVQQSPHQVRQCILCSSSQATGTPLAWNVCILVV